MGNAAVCPSCGLALAGNLFAQSTDYPQADSTVLQHKDKLAAFACWKLSVPAVLLRSTVRRIPNLAGTSP